MGIFARLFGNKPQAAVAPDTAASPPMDANAVNIMLLFDRNVSVDPAAFQAACRKRLAAITDVQLANGKGNFLGNVAFGDDRIMMASLDYAYPEAVLKPILKVCHFAEADKLALQTSRSHVMVAYKESLTDPVVQFDRLYQVVMALLECTKGFLGVVNGNAYTAHPPKLMAAIAEERDALAGPAMPFAPWMAWTGGFVKYFLDAQHIWYVTKGNHQFGLPELAYFGLQGEGNQVMELFIALFSYLHFHKANLAVGHTAELGGMQLEFAALEEYRDLMEGKLGTLVVRKRQ